MGQSPDSDLDVIVSNLLGGQLLVYRNPGNGVFDIPSDKYTFSEFFKPVMFVARDLDRDGSIDLAIADAYGSVCLLWNRGNGQFDYGSCYDLLPYGFLYEIIAEDLDGDDWPDLSVMAIPYDYPTRYVAVYDAGVFILTNDGARGFGDLTWYDIPSWPVLALAGVDVDADGDIDLAGVNSGNALPEPFGMWLLLNDGQGNFAQPIVYSAGLHPHDLDFGDVDGDGDLDVVIPDGTSPGIDPPHPISVLLNQGDGTFLNLQTEDAGFLPYAAVFADLDGDQSLDIAVANFSGYGYTPTLSIFLNLCAKHFDIDFDSNGEVDLRDFVFFTDCFSGPQDPVMAPQCQVSDLDKDGDVDLFDWGHFQVSYLRK